MTLFWTYRVPSVYSLGKIEKEKVWSAYIYKNNFFFLWKIFQISQRSLSSLSDVSTLKDFWIQQCRYLKNCSDDPWVHRHGYFVKYFKKPLAPSAWFLITCSTWINSGALVPITGFLNLQIFFGTLGSISMDFSKTFQRTQQNNFHKNNSG